jgi:hypothetical protein
MEVVLATIILILNKLFLKSLHSLLKRVNDIRTPGSELTCHVQGSLPNQVKYVVKQEG